MHQHYVFFTRNVLPQSDRAKLVQVAHSANAAANLGYSTVLTYLRKRISAWNPLYWLQPFQPQPPEMDLIQAYNLQDNLKIAQLPMPWPIDALATKWFSSCTFACKYYAPKYIFPQAKIVHTREWNFAKAAVKNGVPVIYEHHHYEDKWFEPEIVKNPLFQIAVTVADTVRENMIAHGMPADKVVTLHNGFNQEFLARHPEKAQAWRQKLLTSEYENLVVYAGGLYPFKGVDLLIEVAKSLPKTLFAIAGGNPAQVEAYQQLAQEHQVQNICFLGYLEQAELIGLLQAADALAHPHLLTPAATFTSPLKLFDYMASGTPIVASEIPPLMEFKSTPAIAAWCEPNNAVAFAQALQHVLDTCPKQIGADSEAVNFVRQFSWENRIAKILSYVEPSYRPVCS